ncbi:MAG TPA: SDR family NAD(P)-dependent oxidoreductase [Anaerolineaceae bacterium]
MARLSGKVAIITGGAGGIGAAAARLFVQEGAKVLLVDVNEAALKKVTGEIGASSSYFVADVTRSEDAAAYVKAAVDRFGGLDILLANAGIEGLVTPITDYPVEMFDKVLAINVRGIFLAIKYAAPELAKRGKGSIVCTSSVAGLIGSPGLSAYVTSKHAVIGLMRTAAQELAGANIRVNTVNPAPIETRMMRSIEEMAAPGAAEAVKKNFEVTIPMKRYGLPEEVASLMLFLASDDSAYITGGVYTVDGGMTSG